MSGEQINELTFVARLGTQTALRAERRRSAGLSVLITRGEVEERQLDPATGRYKRCDIRLSGPTNRKLVSGEMKRPDASGGRDPRNELLVQDARRKAIARGLFYYFKCNMAEVVLFSVGARPGDADREERSYRLAPISSSSEVETYMPEILANWEEFLNDLERRLEAVTTTRRPVESGDVHLLREQIFSAADEAVDRVVARVASDIQLADRARHDAVSTFGFNVALNAGYPAVFRDDLLQILRLGIFVVAQKLILYRVLEDSGPRRVEPFILDPLDVPRTSTDPSAIRAALDAATAHAISRSGDYGTAFLPTPHQDLVFLPPVGAEVMLCRAGDVWAALRDGLTAASWNSINQNLVGLLYELIVDQKYRHQLGLHYTREDVVDFLTTFAIRDPGDIVMDPASGGGSFLRAAYVRKRSLGQDHESALSTTWGAEITAFAAELSTITLATADTDEPAAYPRILHTDFFSLRPGMHTGLKIPGFSDALRVPQEFDAIIGNPPYISYRYQTNQTQVLRALSSAPEHVAMPRFSGKSDEYVWFIVHATGFIRIGGRLAFVVSSAILFADYGIPLIRFLSRHYRIRAVIDSMVERWFIDADTNTVLLFLERESDAERRAGNDIRFIRFRRPLDQLFPESSDPTRREALEDLVDEVLSAGSTSLDPRFMVTVVKQGSDGGLEPVPPGDQVSASRDDPDGQDHE